MDATTHPLETRASEAIRFAIEKKLAESFPVIEWRAFGSAVANATGTQFTVSVSNGLALPSPGDIVRVDDEEHTVSACAISGSNASLTLSESVTIALGAVFELGIPLVRKADDVRSVEGLPWLVVVRIIGLRESFPESAENDGTLIVSLDGLTNSLEPDSTEPLTDAERIDQLAAHHARCTALTAALNDVQGIIDQVNAHADNRPCSDLTLYDLDIPEEPGGSASKDVFTFELRRNICVAGVDYAATP
jgi:hypothetical protein